MPSYTNNASIEAYYRGMKEPVNAQIEQAGNDYQAALNRLEQTKATQDAENYRSYVRQQQELPGIMRASGNNGGMVDSAVASLANAYNQARAKRSLEYEGNRANQDLDYNNRLAALRAQLAQYDQMANADKAELAAQQAAAAARARAAARQAQQTATPVNRNNISNNSFVKDYEANRYDANTKATNGFTKAVEAGIPATRLGGDAFSYQNAVMNSVQPPSGTYPTANYKSGIGALEKASTAVGDVDKWVSRNLKSTTDADDFTDVVYNRFFGK
jgi:hypothetical protein